MDMKNLYKVNGQVQTQVEIALTPTAPTTLRTTTRTTPPEAATIEQAMAFTVEYAHPTKPKMAAPTSERPTPFPLPNSILIRYVLRGTENHSINRLSLSLTLQILNAHRGINNVEQMMKGIDLPLYVSGSIRIVQ